MTFRHSKHSLVPTAFAALLLCFCGDNYITFSPSKDSVAMMAIQNSWSGDFGGPITVTLCEDVAANAMRAYTEEDSCSVAHVVQGQRAGEKRSMSTAMLGCGGCEFKVVTYVTATIKTPSGTTLQAHGMLTLGDAYEDDPYDRPYTFSLVRSDSCYYDTYLLSGEILNNGNLRIQLSPELMKYGFNHRALSSGDKRILSDRQGAMCGASYGDEVIYEELGCTDAPPPPPEMDAGLTEDGGIDDPAEDGGEDPIADAGIDDPDQDGGEGIITDGGMDDPDEDGGEDPGLEDSDGGEEPIEGETDGGEDPAEAEDGGEAPIPDGGTDDPAEDGGENPGLEDSDGGEEPIEGETDGGEDPAEEGDV